MPDLSIPPGHDRPGAPGGAPGRTGPRLVAALAIAAATVAAAAPLPRSSQAAPPSAPAEATPSRTPPTAPQAPEPIGAFLRVPLDHEQPSGATIELYYELGAPFDRRLPTLLVVADGQQFYIRRGAMSDLQASLFGPGFNVVGLVGRGLTPEAVKAALGPEGRPDWEKSWRLFRAEQWIEDLETLRATLVGRRSRVLLFGQSGGALLVRQYLAVHGDHVRRAVSAAPVEPFLVGGMGLATDRFWEEIGAGGRELQDAMLSAIARFGSDRVALAMTLQRQNFFVPRDRLGEERAHLIRALAAGETDTYARARDEYQVAEAKVLLDLPEGIPARVRMYELFQPSDGLARLAGSGFHPDLENQRNFAAPLLDLMARGRIEAPALDRGAFHRLATEILVIGGRWDHTVDYRTVFVQAAGYAHGTLFLADDDHMLGRLKAGGDPARLSAGFLRDGPASEAWREALARAAPLRFSEP